MITVDVIWLIPVFIFVSLLMLFLGFVYGYVVSKRIFTKWLFENGYVSQENCEECEEEGAGYGREKGKN